MTIVYKDSFAIRFNRQLEYIAKDNKNAAIRFRDLLKKEINTLKIMPYKCRKSIFFDDENIRDLVFNGYVIVYLIAKYKIEVFGFTKYQDKPTD